MRIEVICKLPSIGNQSLHWSKRRKIIRIQCLMINCAWNKLPQKPTVPCTVTLTRISPRPLDDDNLAYAFKGIRDFVADKLIPRLAKGRADGDPRIEWRYRQEKGNPPKIRVEFYDANAP